MMRETIAEAIVIVGFGDAFLSESFDYYVIFPIDWVKDDVFVCF